MSIKIESTTDTEAQVTAAAGGAKPKEEKVESVAPKAEKPEAAEKDEESDTSKDEAEESESEDDELEEGEQKPKKKSGFKRRIDKLSKQKAELERERDFFREQAMKAQKPEANQEKPKPEGQSKSDGKPDPDSFDTNAEYLEALVEWKDEQKAAANKAKSEEEKLKERVKKTQDDHATRLETFKAAHDDFDETLDDVDDVKMPVYLHDLLIESEMGPELMYELAKNREEYERICTLSYAAAARALGRIEERLSSKASKTEKPIPKKTSAPPPLKPVGSKSASGSTKHPDDMDHQEFKEWRERNQK